MLKHSLIILVALVGSFFLAACNAGVNSRSVKSFEAQVEHIRLDLKNTGLAVVLVKNNSICYHKSFGMRSVENADTLHDDDMFRIASISKSFTTTSLLQLAEQGKVSLSDDVSILAGFYIRNPHYPDIPVTLEMLLSHTSSLNDSQGYFNFDLISDSSEIHWKDCFNDYEPGNGYEYCNLNLNLAGAILERLSGERFDLYIKNHILQPLCLEGGYNVDSLDRSRFVQLYNIYEDSVVNTSLEAYASRGERLRDYRFGYDTPLFSPTGGMKLSALSLAKYMLMHMNYGTSPDGVKIISGESSCEMQRPRSDEENYGLTLWQTDRYSPGVTLTGHTGGAYGMRSAMFFNPEKKYGFVVISSGALEPELDTDPSGSDCSNLNILTRVLSLMYETFVK